MIWGFWLDAKLIKVVSIGGGCNEVKSIGGLGLDTEEDIGSIAWGCPDTIMGRVCIVWEEAANGDSNDVGLQFGALEFIIWVTLLALLNGKMPRDDWISSTVLPALLLTTWKNMHN